MGGHQKPNRGEGMIIKYTKWGYLVLITYI